MSAIRTRRPPYQRLQRGFALGGLVAALLIVTLLSVLASAALKRASDDSAAEATGRYMQLIRSAVVELQVQHEAWLTNTDVSLAPAGTYPDPPELGWEVVGEAEIARGSLSDLRRLGLLSAQVPLFPPLGGSVQFLLSREGECPGRECRTAGYVYTCHPINSVKSAREPGPCNPPGGDRARVEPDLLAKVIISAGGYGAHDAFGGDRVHGALVDAPRAWFDFGDELGHAVLTASLEALPFGQFVRHGETRPVALRNTLTVDGQILTNTGLVFGTAVMPGAPCDVAGMYASTAQMTLATCRDGAWFATQDNVVTGVYSNLPHDAAVPPVVCPSGLSPWRHASLQAADVTVTGSDVNVAGTLGGTITGTGSVNAAGTVVVNGSFSGTFQNAGSSYVRVSQRISIAADRVAITPPGAGARASVIQGCSS